MGKFGGRGGQVEVEVEGVEGVFEEEGKAEDG